MAPRAFDLPKRSSPPFSLRIVISPISRRSALSLWALSSSRPEALSSRTYASLRDANDENQEQASSRYPAPHILEELRAGKRIVPLAPGARWFDLQMAPCHFLPEEQMRSMLAVSVLVLLVACGANPEPQHAPDGPALSRTPCDARITGAILSQDGALSNEQLKYLDRCGVKFAQQQ